MAQLAGLVTCAFLPFKLLRRQSINEPGWRRWSLGCLLYERAPPLPSDCRMLVLTLWRGAVATGTFLFDDSDFSRFFARVCTEDGEPLVTVHDREKLGDARLANFLEFMLVRDPAIRPSAASVLQHFDATFPETGSS